MFCWRPRNFMPSFELMDFHENDTIQNKISVLGGDIAPVLNGELAFNPHTTHMIISDATMTSNKLRHKLLIGIARGVWVLREQ